MSLNYLKDKNNYSLLLQKYEEIFEATLRKYKGFDCTTELKKYTKPNYTKSFPIPKAHKPTLKKEVNRLFKLGVLWKINNTQWTASYT